MTDARVDPAAEVVELCRDLIRIDTSNYGDQDGPGEREGRRHVATLLDEVGIESRPQVWSDLGRRAVGRRYGRADVGRQRAACCCTATSTSYPHGPRTGRSTVRGEIQDGYLWGRGAVDMKDFDAMLLAVVRARQRSGRVPARPITLCFTADEEAAATAAPRCSSRSTPTSSRAAPRPWGSRRLQRHRPDAASTWSRRPRRA